MIDVPPLRKFQPSLPPDSTGVEGMRRLEFSYPEAGALAADPVSTRADVNGGVAPFQGLDASAAGIAKVKFAYGTVRNASPTFGGNPVFPESDEATVSDGDKFYLDAQLDAAGNVTSLVATQGSSVPPDGSGHYYRLLFEVEVSGGAVTAIGQSVTSNLYLFLCNGMAVWDRA